VQSSVFSLLFLEFWEPIASRYSISIADPRGSASEKRINRASSENSRAGPFSTQPHIVPYPFYPVQHKMEKLWSSHNLHIWPCVCQNDSLVNGKMGKA
jgi:hypothetical protein